MNRIILITILSIYFSYSSTAISKTNCNIKEYITGNINDIKTKTEYGLFLMGGGEDVDQAFKEMTKRSGGGDFVIIRSSGSDGYNNYIYKTIGGVNSVKTLIIDSKEKAMCKQVENTIRNAEALFIAGGDQSEYYKYWNKTPIQKAINYLINEKNIPIGGTSAGLAILGEVIFTAEFDTITSEEALKNALDKKITLRNNFLDIPILKNIITDSHFDQRKRQGRLISFLANSIKIHNKALNGIGIDEQTSLVIEKNGDSKVIGKNYVWMFSIKENISNVNNKKDLGILNNTPKSYKPLNWNENNKIKVIKLKELDNNKKSFNIKNWSILSENIDYFYYKVKNGELKKTEKL